MIMRRNFPRISCCSCIRPKHSSVLKRKLNKNPMPQNIYIQAVHTGIKRNSLHTYSKPFALLL